MKRSRTLLLLLGVVAFIHLGVLGWMIWSHHRVLAQGELIGIDLGLVYISEFSAEHSVFINPAVNIINRQPGEYFPDTDYSVPHRAWLTFETDEDGLSIPASWSLNRPDDTKGYLQISLRPSGRFSPAEMRITYPFGSYRLDHFTLSEELQQQIAEGHPNTISQRQGPYKAMAHIRIYRGNHAVERIDFDVYKQPAEHVTKL